MGRFFFQQDDQLDIQISRDIESLKKLARTLFLEYTTPKWHQNSQALKMKRKPKLKTGQVKLKLWLIQECLPLSY